MIIPSKNIKIRPEWQRAIFFFTFFVLTVPIMHEAGHIAIALLTNNPIIEVVILSLNPHVFVTYPSIPFFLGGQLFMPVWFFIYYSISHEKSYIIWFGIIVGMFLGSSLDFFNILYILQ